MTGITMSEYLLTKCAAFSLRVYKTGIILKKKICHQRKDRTLSWCAIFSLRDYKTGIFLRNFFINENIAQGVQYFP